MFLLELKTDGAPVIAKCFCPHNLNRILYRESNAAGDAIKIFKISLKDKSYNYKCYGTFMDSVFLGVKVNYNK